MAKYLAAFVCPSLDKLRAEKLKCNGPISLVKEMSRLHNVHLMAKLLLVCGCRPTVKCKWAERSIKCAIWRGKKSTRKHNVVAKACAVREAVVVKGIAP